MAWGRSRSRETGQEERGRSNERHPPRASPNSPCNSSRTRVSPTCASPVGSPLLPPMSALSPAGSVSNSASNSRSNSPARGRSLYGSVTGAYPGPGPSSNEKKEKSSSRNSSTTGLKALLSSPTIRLEVAEDCLFTHPTGKPGEPTYDPSIEGTVSLFLPQARTLRHLSVKLVGIMDIGWTNRPYESFICLEKELTLLDEDVDTHLEKGDHVFQFSIIVPSSTAIYERSTYGRVRHFLRAKAKMGRGMGADLRAEKSIYLIANPGGAGESEPPPGMHHKMEGYDQALGPFTMALKSQHIMTAGLILFRLNLICPPNSLAIHSIKIRINQFFVLKSGPGREFYTETPPESKIQVCQLDFQHPPNNGIILNTPITTPGTRSGSQTPRSAPLVVLDREQAYRIQHVVRLPNDNFLRGSTQAGCVTSINIRHEIAVDLTYEILNDAVDDVIVNFDRVNTDSSAASAGSVSRSRDRSGKGKGKEREIAKPNEKKVMTITKPMELYHCSCFISSLSLPPYAEDDPHEPLDPDKEVPCLCMEPLADIVKNHLTGLLDEDDKSAVTYAQIIKEEPEDTEEDMRGRTSARS